jgi:glyoxylase-like metal-dependent hydrolase (beta-lactamase superfamily II)/8-oxo-dGTP pyrophosphatase MutT (NUDIX family)
MNMSTSTTPNAANAAAADADYDILADARKAASVIVLRDLAEGGVEVLMMRRAERDGDMRSGAAVFPGGVLDARDRHAHAHVLGWDDDGASARLSLSAGGLDYLVAAARECFEEAGLLFACPPGAATLEEAAGDPGFGEVLDRAHAQWRGPMQRGEQPVAALCEGLGLRLDLREWAYFSHWLTPPGQPRRFDTRFFVTRAPARQQAEADYGEAVELMWLTPQAALEPERGLKLLPVTRETLRRLATFDSVQAALDHARAQPEVVLTMPRRAETAKGQRVVLPHETAYAEIGRIDPAGRGLAWADIVPGRVVRLSARVLRVTAPNAGMMTGPGTNSYLVGDPATNRWTVIDPGPDDASHRQALLAAAPGPLERILVTHTHVDHSPGAAPLARATGAPVLGRRPLHAAGQDATFAPDEELYGGEVLALGPDATLRVLHTPGHASNHLCYLLEQERTLFTGDHVMQGSTVVINPPDGDMAAYLHALEALHALALDWFAPGHGFLVARPHEVVRALVRHRLGREAKVVAALAALGPAALEGLVVRVYDDVPAALHPVARRSLLAHLLKLEGEGRATCAAGHWSAA